MPARRNTALQIRQAQERDAKKLAAQWLCYLIPGCDGPPSAEWELARLRLNKSGKWIPVRGSPPVKKGRTKLGVFKVGLAVPRGSSKGAVYPTVEFARPKLPIFQIAPGGPRFTFVGMCLQAGGLLRLKGHKSKERPPMAMFLRFAAYFAVENPELWGQFLTAVPTTDEENLTPTQVRIALDLKRELDKTAKKGQAVSSIVRGSAAWLALRLVNHEADAQATLFLKPFQSGENDKAAKTHPIETYTSDDDLEAEDAYWDAREKYATAMFHWQAKRRKILRWPKATSAKS